jgi:hypothetical protein
VARILTRRIENIIEDRCEEDQFRIGRGTGTKDAIVILRIIKGKGKGKAVPLEAWSVPEGSRKLRFADFMTTAEVGGKVVSFTHRPPLPPGNTPGTHFC